MKKKINNSKKRTLKESLLSEDFEESMVFEDGVDTDVTNSNPTPDAPLDLQNISLDKKFDHFMIQYERESLPTSAKYQEPNLSPMEKPSPAYPNESRLSRLVGVILNEQDAADAGADAPPPDAGGGGDAPDAGGGTDPNTKPDVRPPTMNIQNFARSIARLVNNYEALCDPKSTMVNRARAYILKNYNPNLAKEFMIILETQYDLTPRSNADKPATPGPAAVGAWGGGGGGGGGGGE